MKISVLTGPWSAIVLAAVLFGTSTVYAAETTKSQTASKASTSASANSSSMHEGPKVAEFCWNELATSNLQSAKDFYSNVFGWSFTEHPMGEMNYTIVKANGKDFAGIWSIPKEQESQIPSHWLSYILVENLEQSLEKALKNGATLMKPITTAGEQGRFAVIKDPTGAHLALWQPLKKP